MKKTSRFFAVIVTVAALLSLTAFSAGAVGTDDFYVVNNVLVRYKGSDIDVVIPDSLGITTISSYAFNNEPIRSVKIPNGVTTIQENAFSDSNIQYVTLPHTLTTIGPGAFSGTNLTYVNVPGSVSLIDKTVFSGCSSLKTVDVQSGVQSIAQAAFFYSPLTSLYLPASVTSIDQAIVSQSTRSDLVVTCEAGSAAAAFAVNQNFHYTTVSNYAVVSGVGFSVNGKNVSVAAYNIDGNNYFKLRDLADVISGTPKQFDVSWDDAYDIMNIASAKAYTPVGGELAALGAKPAFTASRSGANVCLDGVVKAVKAYNIDGNNYFKLRDVASVLNFGVTYDSASNTISVDTGSAYKG